MTAAGERDFYFGPFRLFPEQQLLLEGNTPVRLGSRSLEILTVLVEHAGDLLDAEGIAYWTGYRDFGGRHGRGTIWDLGFWI